MLDDPLENSAPSEPQVETATCAYSGDVYPVSQMVKYGDKWVAAIHKDAFVQSLGEVADPEASSESVLLGYRESIIWWEKARVLYNAIVGLTGLLFSFGLIQEMGGIAIYLFLAGLYGIAANICYFAAPFVDLYLHILFSKRASSKMFRCIVFGLGTGFSLLLTIGIAGSLQMMGLLLPEIE